MTSAFPSTIDELIPRAQRLARELGRLPSRNRVMSTLNIGAPKATAVLAALTESGFDPATPDPDTNQDANTTGSESGPARRLHAVHDDHRPEASAAPTLAGHPAPVAGDLVSTDRPADHVPVPSGLVTLNVDPGVTPAVSGWVARARRWWPAGRGSSGTADPDLGVMVRAWPLVLLALPAFVAIWSGWVGLGVMTGFGPVHPLPGIADGFTINSAITLPIGVETYAAYALRVWLAGAGSDLARRFARASAIGALVLGAAGQVAYHLMTAQHVTAAPWPITTAVACLPVVVLGFGAALAHLQRHRNGSENPR